MNHLINTYLAFYYCSYKGKNSVSLFLVRRERIQPSKSSVRSYKAL